MDPLEREHLLAPSLSNRLPLPSSDALLRPPFSNHPTPPLPGAKKFTGRRSFGQSPPATHSSPPQTRSSPLRSVVKKAPFGWFFGWRFGGAAGGRPPSVSPRLSTALILILFGGMFAQVYFSERWRGQVSAKWKFKRSNLIQPHGEPHVEDAVESHQEVRSYQTSRWRQGKGQGKLGDDGQAGGQNPDGATSIAKLAGSDPRSVEVRERGRYPARQRGASSEGKEGGDAEGRVESPVGAATSLEQPRPQSAGGAAEVIHTGDKPSFGLPTARQQQADGGMGERRQEEGISPSTATGPVRGIPGGASWMGKDEGAMRFGKGGAVGRGGEDMEGDGAAFLTAGMGAGGQNLRGGGGRRVGSEGMGDSSGGEGSAAELSPDELEEAVSLLSYTIRKKKVGGATGRQKTDPEWEGVFADPKAP